MEQPWYRQYFWLLVFGGIVIFTAIITFVMICVCKSHFSKRVTVKIQKTFRRKNNHTNHAAYHIGVPPVVTIPEERNNEAVFSPTNLPQALYATTAKTKQPKHLDPEYNGNKYKKKEDMSYQGDRYSYASYDSQGYLTNINSNNTFPSGHNYNAKKDNLNPNKHYINDRYSSASYDSVAPISKADYKNVLTSGHKYNAKKDHLDPNKLFVNDRYSTASYDSVGPIAGSDYRNSLTFGPKYPARKGNTESYKNYANDRYSFSSFDSDDDYSNVRTSVIPKDQEYVDVITEEDGSDYDNVNI